MLFSGYNRPPCLLRFKIFLLFFMLLQKRDRVRLQGWASVYRQRDPSRVHPIDDPPYPLRWQDSSTCPLVGQDTGFFLQELHLFDRDSSDLANYWHLAVCAR
ncbi:hypothetical protein AVEN_86784-1 [Araneus ventricosus]|uniref:Secreted protein n=1 Tax=Araneus ventricosus TaxID=182803 RepID=A0A4Y2VTR2_ARAVE|nr:hypothetical protein AVEN_86784-1 [Araneus ventricosus]